MTNLIPDQTRIDGRLAPVTAMDDRKSLSDTVDQALKLHRFCDVERALIVQIVCDALLPVAQVKEPAPAR